MTRCRAVSVGSRLAPWHGGGEGVAWDVRRAGPAPESGGWKSRPSRLRADDGPLHDQFAVRIKECNGNAFSDSKESLEFSSMNATRFFALVALSISLCFAGCNTGLDPRKFEEVRYGMPRADVLAVLQPEPSELQSELRFFARQGRGAAEGPVEVPVARPVEWRVERHSTLHPHPDYYTVYVDGALTSVLLAEGIQAELYREEGWSRGEIEALAAQWSSDRAPLTWAELEPLDTAQHSREPDPTTYTIATFIVFPYALPVLVAMPVLVPLASLLGLDTAVVEEKRSTLVDALDRCPAGADREAVVALCGEPSHVETQWRESGRLDVWVWEVRDGRNVAVNARCGFEDGELVWIDYQHGVGAVLRR